MICIKFPKN